MFTCKSVYNKIWASFVTDPFRTKYFWSLQTVYFIGIKIPYTIWPEYVTERKPPEENFDAGTPSMMRQAFSSVDILVPFFTRWAIVITLHPSLTFFPVFRFHWNCIGMILGWLSIKIGKQTGPNLKLGHQALVRLAQVGDIMAFVALLFLV